MMKPRPLALCAAGLAGITLHAQSTPPPSSANVYIQLMTKAKARAAASGSRQTPVLSPDDATVLTPAGADTVPVGELQQQGIEVIPWTTDEPAKMRQLIALGVNGIITDRPDVLQQVLTEARAAATPEELVKLEHFDVSAHRGGRGLRPENTLPSFESGMDQGSTTLETDTGVTKDGYSLIWHDQFLNPLSCRMADGSPYTMANRAYTMDMTLRYAQTHFICDKLRFGTAQRNDLSLSPVAVAFAKREGMISPYAPTYAAQLFRFVRFYTQWYTNGPGRNDPHAAERAHTGATIRFNLETKLFPDVPAVALMAPKGTPPDELKDHTFGPQKFVTTLCGEVKAEHMLNRSEIQSFDFRTLQLVEMQYPMLPTYYLTGPPAMLSTTFLPASLRVTP